MKQIHKEKIRFFFQVTTHTHTHTHTHTYKIYLFIYLFMPFLLRGLITSLAFVHFKLYKVLWECYQLGFHNVKFLT